MRVLFLILSSFNLIFAGTKLEGDISGRIFNKRGNPYIIEKELLISGEDPTIIEHGCLFLFNPFTGIKVSGSLIVKGTTKSPVIFTTIKNGLLNKQDREIRDNEVFDWNGIIILEKAKEVKFMNFELSNSIFGLKSSTSNIIVHQGIFRNNGDFNLIIRDEILNVKEGIPYDYGILPKLGKEQKDIAKVVEISTLSISAAIFCSMGWSLYKANLYHKKYVETKHPIQMEEYKHSKNICLEEARTMGIIGVALFSIGIGSLICNRERKDLSQVSFFILPYSTAFYLCINM
jgi:hypothetical protein